MKIDLVEIGCTAFDSFFSSSLILITEDWESRLLVGAYMALISLMK